MNARVGVTKIVLVLLSISLLLSSLQIPTTANDEEAGPTISLITPTNGTTSLYKQPKCRVQANDVDGGTLFVNFYDNSSGTWTHRQKNTTTAGTILQWNFSHAIDYQYKYWWKVTVYDGTTNRTYIFNFKTKYSVYTFRTHGEQIKQWRTLIAAHPSQASATILGHTYEDRDIWAFKVGNPSGGVVIWDASTHGWEDLGAEIAYLFADWLLNSGDASATTILNQNYWIFVPSVNNDTSDRDNMNYTVCGNGVDLNRNYVSGFNYVSDCLGDYGDSNGGSAGSEPETQTMRALMNQYSPTVTGKKAGYVNCHYGGGPYFEPRGKKWWNYGNFWNISVRQPILAMYNSSGITPQSVSPIMNGGGYWWTSWGGGTWGWLPKNPKSTYSGYAVSDAANLFGYCAVLFECLNRNGPPLTDGPFPCWSPIWNWYNNENPPYSIVNHSYWNLTKPIFLAMSSAFANTSASANITDIYVNGSSGNDITGNGSWSNPYKTIQKAVNVSENGDTIYIRGGTYLPNKVITVGNKLGSTWLTIRNYPGEYVIVNGSNCPTSYYINATFELINCNYIRLTGINVNHSRKGGITLRSGCTHIQVDNCTIGNCSAFGFKSNWDMNNITLEHCLFYNNFNNWSGVSLSQETISFSKTNNFTIRYNKLINNHCENIDVKNACRRGTIHHNYINTTAGRTVKSGLVYYGGDGIYLDARGVEHNISIYSNYICGNNTAIELNDENSSGHLENITVYNNIIAVTNLTGEKPNFNGRVGFGVGNLGPNVFKDIRIYSNTIYCGRYNKYAVLQFDTQLHKEKMRRINISNNIFITGGNCDAAIIFYGVNSTDNAININKNLFYRFNSSSPNNGLNKIKWADGTWNQSTPSKWGRNALLVDPQLSGIAIGDFHLNASSPAINSASSSPMPSKDLDGVNRPQGGGYDLGAYERYGVALDPHSIYVAKTGDDVAGNGTFDNPYKTIWRGCNVSSNGDTVYIRQGTYKEEIVIYKNNNATGDWLTIKPYDGETVIVDGSAVGTQYGKAVIRIKWSNYVRVSGLIIKNSTNNGIAVQMNADHVRIDNCTIDNISAMGIHVNKIGREGNGPGPVSNVSIEYNTISRTQSNYAGTASGEGLSVGSGVIYADVHHNYMYLNHCENIDMKSGCSRSIVHHNRINTTEPTKGTKGGGTYYGGVGIYVDGYGLRCHNVSVYNNKIWGNNTGISITAEQPTGTVKDISVFNNVINITQKSGTGIDMSNNNGTEVTKYNVTIYSNTVYMNPAASQTCLRFGSHLEHYVNCKAKNNIFAIGDGTADYVYVLQFNYINLTDDLTGKIELDYNIYYRYPGAWSAIRINWHTGASTSGGGSNSKKVNPQFVNRRISNFHLNATSPAVDNATASLNPLFDMDGNSRPNGPNYDMGAFEYTGGLSNFQITGYASEATHGRHATDNLNFSATIVGATEVYINILTPKGTTINQSLLQNYSASTGSYWCNRNFSNGKNNQQTGYGWPSTSCGNGTYYVYIFAKTGSSSSVKSSTEWFNIRPTADITMDAITNFMDLTSVTGDFWGQTGKNRFNTTDANGDGRINFNDLTFITGPNCWGWDNTV
jgi:hypothetical protein